MHLLIDIGRKTEGLKKFSIVSSELKLNRNVFGTSCFSLKKGCVKKIY